ncbi:hypothetical protein [Paenibacillus sp. FSL L8-0708]
MKEEEKQDKEVTAQSATSKPCSKCNHIPNKETYKFCTRCGNELGS